MLPTDPRLVPQEGRELLAKAFRAGFQALLSDGRWTFDGVAARDLEPHAFAAWMAAGCPDPNDLPDPLAAPPAAPPVAPPAQRCHATMTNRDRRQQGCELPEGHPGRHKRGVWEWEAWKSVGGAVVYNPASDPVVVPLDDPTGPVSKLDDPAAAKALRDNLWNLYHPAAPRQESDHEHSDRRSDPRMEAGSGSGNEAPDSARGAADRRGDSGAAADGNQTLASQPDESGEVAPLGISPRLPLEDDAFDAFPRLWDAISDWTEDLGDFAFDRGDEHGIRKYKAEEREYHKLLSRIEEALLDAQQQRTALEEKQEAEHRDWLLHHSVLKRRAEAAEELREKAEADLARLTEARDTLQRERDEARVYSRVLAFAYESDTRPPQNMVRAGLSYPVVNGPETIAASVADALAKAEARADAATQALRQLRDYVRHPEACAVSKTSGFGEEGYEALWSDEDAATCTCGLAALLPPDPPEPTP